MASAAFERFRFSFFEDPYSPRDGLDLAALAALEGDERSRAEDMLLALHGLPDQSADSQHVIHRVMSDNPERREGGKRDLLAAIAGRPISAQ